ncbi:hypothetical protein ACTFIY_007130 [Dictyostelium cf. discoideum]
MVLELIINDASKSLNIQLNSFSRDTDTSIVNLKSVTYKNTRYITQACPTIRWVGDVQWASYEDAVKSSPNSAMAPGVFGGVNFQKGKPHKVLIDCAKSGLSTLENSKNAKFFALKMFGCTIMKFANGKQNLYLISLGT